MILFKRLNYKNFLSSGNQPIIIDLDKSQMTLIVGTNGSGKSTLVHALLEQNLSLAFSISATSRTPRPKEKDGFDYYFLTPRAFEKKIKEKAFVEYEEVYPRKFYGTLHLSLIHISEPTRPY